MNEWLMSELINQLIIKQAQEKREDKELEQIVKGALLWKPHTHRLKNL